MDYLWQDRKRTLFGLPWSFTKYRLTSEKFITEKGFLNTREEEVRLYRIVDVSLSISFMQRIFGLGSIHVCSMDQSTPEFDIKSIKRPKETKEKLSDLIESERERKGVISREYTEHDHI